MATLGGDGGGLHAAGAAAHHHTWRGLSPASWPDRPAPARSPGCWMQDIGEALEPVADTGLVAGDAGTDVVDAPVRALVCNSGSQIMRPRHAAHIGLAGRRDTARHPAAG